MVAIKKIGKVDFEQMGGRSTAQRDIETELAALAVDEGIVVEVEGWVLKTSPTHFVYPYAKETGKKFSCRNLQERGWAILRTA